MKAKELAMEISNFINCGNNDDRDELVRLLHSDHRTLQEEFNMMLVKYILRCGDKFKRGEYDGRNKYSVALLARVAEFLEEGKY